MLTCFQQAACEFCREETNQAVSQGPDWEVRVCPKCRTVFSTGLTSEWKRRFTLLEEGHAVVMLELRQNPQGG